MKLMDFVTVDSDDQKTIKSVRFLVADHRDRERRTALISAQISTELPTVRNGALLRAEVLRQARDILEALAADYERLGRQVDRPH